MNSRGLICLSLTPCRAQRHRHAVRPLLVAHSASSRLFTLSVSRTTPPAGCALSPCRAQRHQQAVHSLLVAHNATSRLCALSLSRTTPPAGCALSPYVVS